MSARSSATYPPSRSAPHRAPACPHRSRAHPSCRWRGDDPHDRPEASGKALGADQRPSSRSVLRSQPPRAPRLFGATISPRASPFACPDHASKSMEYRVGTNGSLTRTRSPSGRPEPSAARAGRRVVPPRSVGNPRRRRSRSLRTTATRRCLRAGGRSRAPARTRTARRTRPARCWSRLPAETRRVDSGRRESRAGEFRGRAPRTRQSRRGLSIGEQRALT